MPGWAWIAAVYGLVLAGAAFTTALRRRWLVASAAVGYTLLACAAATVASVSWAALVIPGCLLLTGYWLSGFFFHDPQPRLETWLLLIDRRLFAALDADFRLSRAPQWMLELLEACYASVYLVIAGGAAVAFTAGDAAVSHYWTVVLGSELACYAMLPWLRSRPPRALEPAGALAVRGPRLRRLNAAVLDRASVQANTLPSGHVAGAVAAALAIAPVSTPLAVVLMVVSVGIAVAAVAGRYHYAVDCAAGVLVAGVVSVLT
jgi:hypothetical protein